MVRSEREGLDGSTALVSDMFMNGVDNMVTNHTVSGFAQIAENWDAINNPANSFYSNAIAGDC